MNRTFNCGIGMTLVVAQADAKATIDGLASLGVEAFEIGSIVPRQGGGPKTVVL
jgi:phosphoribosylformylglycinamidine cyclo-ligase